MGSSSLIKCLKVFKMPRTVKDYMDFVLDVRNNIPNQTERILKQNETVILDLNRQEQLYEHGEDMLGFSLQDYSPFTVEIKNLLGQPSDRTTLFYSGEFYKSFKIIFNKSELTLTIIATDRKTPKLILKYGEDILGLNKGNQDELNYKILQPELIKYIKQWL